MKASNLFGRARGFVMLAGMILLLAGTTLAAPTVASVNASQRQDGSRLVDIYYDLSGGTGPMTVSVVVSPDNGASWSVSPSPAHLSGDVGSEIANGSGRHIVWNAGADKPNIYWPSCKVRVTATEGSIPDDEITVYLPGGVALVLVRIPTGSFLMGRYPGEQDSYSTEDPQHLVTIAYDFYMGKYELTKAQWTAVMGTTPWSGQSYVLNDPNSPAVYVSWNDALSFVSALNTHLSSTGQDSATMRLPSEAEWEYACRAGTTTRFYWGNDPSYTEMGDYGWFISNRNGSYAHVVGRKLPNAWGLCDMSGNVWEWCQDDSHSSYTGAPTDGSAEGDGSGSYRVNRSGSWGSYAGHSRSAYRDYHGPTYVHAYDGFRLAADR